MASNTTRIEPEKSAGLIATVSETVPLGARLRTRGRDRCARADGVVLDLAAGFARMGFCFFMEFDGLV